MLEREMTLQVKAISRNCLYNSRSNFCIELPNKVNKSLSCYTPFEDLLKNLGYELCLENEKIQQDLRLLRSINQKQKEQDERAQRNPSLERDSMLEEYTVSKRLTNQKRIY